jgi:hypothetical protein
MNALNLVRITGADIAQQTTDELDLADRHSVELTTGVTLHAGMRNGIPTFVVQTAGAADLSAVISTEPLDE